MTFSTGGAIDASGCICEATIMLPSKLRQALGARSTPDIEARLPIRMLVDTGASYTSIGTSFVRRLGLHGSDTVRMYHAGGVGVFSVFRVDLEFNQATVFRDLRVVQIDSGQIFEGLLGRDVLANSRLSYDGMRKHWSIELVPTPSILGM